MRRRVRDALWKISDWLCSHRLTFGAGHWVGELGWRLREDGLDTRDGKGEDHDR